MARDLHDGLAQELAFIVTQTRRVAAKDNPGDETLAAIDRAEAQFARGEGIPVDRPVDFT